MGCFWTLLVEGVSGLLAWIAWRRLTGCIEHPAVARARKWGDLTLISAEVERDLQTAVKLKCSSWTLTQDYAIKNQVFGFDLSRMDNLAWDYLKVVKRRINMIPIGKEGAVALNFSDRKCGDSGQAETGE